MWDQLKRLQRVMENELSKYAAMMKEWHSGTTSCLKRSDIESQKAKLDRIQKQIDARLEEAEAELGLPVGFFDAVEDSEQSETTRLWRTEQAASCIEISDYIEAGLAKALDELRPQVPATFLNDEYQNTHLLDKKYLSEPLSLVAGCRLESETRPVHRFAHALVAAEHFLTDRRGYDFHAGSLSLPELARLGFLLPALAGIPRYEERLEFLYKGPSQSYHSTMHELLVAGSCARYGVDLEFLSTTSEKTPDLRIRDFGVPTVVECKRKQFLSNYELEEEKSVRRVFSKIRSECLGNGIYGIFDVNFTVEVAQVNPQDVADAARRSAASAEVFTAQAWGRIAFRELPKRIEMPKTILYTPEYLQWIFGWNWDVPTHDGLVCAVSPPRTIEVDVAECPIGLKWRSQSESAKRRKARPLSDLLKKAFDQVPTAEMGFIYLCYREGTRPEIADERTNFILDQFRDWKYKGAVKVIPVIYLQRLYPRIMPGGGPDLIENTVRLADGAKDRSLADLLPSVTFSTSS